MEHGRQHACRSDTVLTIIAVTGYGPGQIVVPPEQGIPSLAVKPALPFGKNGFQCRQINGVGLPFSEFLSQKLMT
jgi:hypothetical protein